MARSQMVEVREMPRQLVCGSKWDQLSTDIWHKFMANQQTSNNYINKINLFKRIYAPIKVIILKFSKGLEKQRNIIKNNVFSWITQVLQYTPDNVTFNRYYNEFFKLSLLFLHLL